MPGKTNAEQMKRKVSGCRAALAQVSTYSGHFFYFVLVTDISCCIFALRLFFVGSRVVMERVNAMNPD
jgi:hypothetical protein